MAATLGEGREPTLAADAQLGCLYARRREQLRALILHINTGKQKDTTEQRRDTTHALFVYHSFVSSNHRIIDLRALFPRPQRAS